MSSAKQLHTPQEVARLGAEVFDRRVRPALLPEDDGKYVAVDITTGDYEIDSDDYAAVARLRKRNPLNEIWLERVGQPAAYHMRGNIDDCLEAAPSLPKIALIAVGAIDGFEECEGD